LSLEQSLQVSVEEQTLIKRKPTND